MASPGICKCPMSRRSRGAICSVSMPHCSGCRPSINSLKERNLPMAKTISLLLALAMCGCSTIGQCVKEEQLTGFVPKQTTYSEIVSKLGRPTNEMRHTDGTREVEYNCQHERVNPEAVIPGFGMFFKERSIEHSQTMRDFDQEGWYITYSQGQWKIDIGRGPIVGRP